MIEPKQKAIELYNKYMEMPYPTHTDRAKKCAIIAVNVIIDLLPNINLIPPIQRKADEFYFQYWVCVKNEIEKL